MSEKAFRRDINGLRAWAVAAVVLYHFGIPGFAGGFVGVDVFFVISGFLMTQIIVERLQSPRGLSIAEFYLARATRIVPALLTLCLVLLAAGWFFLPPIEYRLLGNHVIAAATFLSNVKFWREAGYFDSASHEKWLLHTWSLSVEWQFYLVLPILAALFWKLKPGRRFMSFWIAAMLLVSLGMAIAFSRTAPTASFYLLHTRAWEMFAGGLLYLWAPGFSASERTRVLMELAGFGLIVLAVVVFGPTTPWPYAYAVVPVLGASLVIAANRPASAWTRWSVVQWAGNTSYSIYLWHWPVVVALTSYQLAAGFFWQPVLGIGVTAVLAHLSYRFVERVSRTRLRESSVRTATIAFAAFIAVAILPAAWVRVFDGVPGRLPPSIEAVFAEAANRNPRVDECHVESSRKLPECTYGGARLGAIVIGDSHAEALVRTIERVLPDKSLHVLDWSLSSCPTLLGVRKEPGRPSANCGEVIESLLQKQSRFPPDVPLIIANRASFYVYGPTELTRRNERFPSVYFDRPVSEPSTEFLAAYSAALSDTACAFARTRPVYLLRPVPEMSVNVPKAMGRAMQASHPIDVSITIAQYRKRNEVVLRAQDQAAARCGVKLLDPTQYLCSAQRCPGAIGGRPLYFDENHLSEYGAHFLIPMFREVFAHPVGPRAPPTLANTPGSRP